MKGTLHPRKKVRLRWFTGSVNVTIKRTLVLTYNLRSVRQDVLKRKVNYNYQFDGETIAQREIPASPMILSTGGLPFLWTRTNGSVAEKLATVDLIDHTFQIEERIVEIKRGEEKISVKDSPHPDRQIETKEREDLIVRKVSIKNELGKDAKVIVRMFETGNIVFLDADPKPDKQDRPLHEWVLSVPKDEEQNVQLNLKVHVVETREIEKPKPVKLELKDRIEKMD